MTGRRAAIAVALGLLLAVSVAEPASAHGVGARADLPLPVWLFAYSAAFALVISFVALRILWPRPRLDAAARGRVLAPAFELAARILRAEFQVVALALFAVTMVAAWVGPDSVADNVAPTALYIALWVGMPVLSAVVGDVWRRANPLWMVAAALDRLRGLDPDESVATGWWSSHWPAALGLLAFQWLELAYHRPASLLAVALFLTVYALIVVGLAWRFGAGWVRTGDGFAVLFSLVAALAPLSRGGDGRLRVRWPGSGLARVEVRSGTMAVVLVVLGGTTFDGVSRTAFWRDVSGSSTGWEATALGTMGLVATVAVVSGLYLAAMSALRILSEDEESIGGLARRWVPSLVPIVLAYAIAHYFSLLVFEGQSFVALLSDPLGEGWDLFGTADDQVDYTVVSPNQIAYVQVASIVVGHVGGVIAAHDRAVERYDHRRAVRGQYPLLAVMVAYTVGGLLLLLNA